jgi:hypothetical protein
MQPANGVLLAKSFYRVHGTIGGLVLGADCMR